MAFTVWREQNAPLRIPTRALTHEGFREWAVSDEFPERGRISWISGELWVDMSPESLETHNAVKVASYAYVHGLIRELDIGRFYGSCALVSNAAAGFSTEPDSLFATWDTLGSDRLRRVPLKDHPDECMELEGTPDWVMEIVSDSSDERDTQALRKAFHRAGIPEYWLIDARGDQIDFQMLQHRAHGYEPAQPRDGWLTSEIFPRSFRLDRERDRIGGWRYTLHVR